jgi:hypothetical protein
LSKAYHASWGIEELYKISKEFIGIEDFHSHSERGVLQECYAHLLMVNIARIFENEANKHLPDLSKNKSITIKLQDNYWKDFCGEFAREKINFKNCLLVLGRSLVKLVYSINLIASHWLDNLIQGMSGIRQKIRRGRHEPRVSRRPLRKWRSASRGKTSATS